MCRCCQTCLEDCYWNCIEEKFCYDESIAYYNPEEDDYYHQKKAFNGVTSENNNAPIVNQPPSLLDRHCSVISSKIHEGEFCREIQTNVPILAPEILSVFANSQIFHEHQPKTLKPSVSKQQSTEIAPVAIHKKNVNRTDSEKLLDRLEGRTITDGPIIDTSQKSKVSVLLNDVQLHPSPSGTSLTSRPSSRLIESIKEEDTSSTPNETNVDEIQLRPKLTAVQQRDLVDGDIKTFLKPKSIFDFRPVSENDIYTITQSYGQISAIPETPQIRYSNLPKNYKDTPEVGEYRETRSLYSIQTAESARVLELDQLKMPRTYSKSMLLSQQHQQQTPPARVHSAENLTVHTTQKKSKRLNTIRKQLPPLLINTSLKDE